MDDIKMSRISRVSQGTSECDQPDEIDEMVAEYGFSSGYLSYSCVKTLKKVVAVVLIPMVITAIALSVLVIIEVGDNDAGLSYQDVITGEIASYFPSLVDIDDEIDVRVGSGACDTEYCDDSDTIFCEREGALRTLQSNGANLLCVCDGYHWECEVTGKFCKSNPLLPSGAQFLPDKSCINTASSKTCPFTCKGSLVPSGEFTCNDGQWDTQYCVCTSSELESVIDEMNAFGVINTENCDLTNSGDDCELWECKGDLRKSYLAEVKCGISGWELSGSEEALCVCKNHVLFTTLAKNGVDYVNVFNCDDTPAGKLCDNRDWLCPYKLHQQGEFECSKKDGSWIVTNYPCVCSEEYAKNDIPEFDSGCNGYLSVGQTCDYDEWSCDDSLIPITPLECTPDGLKGECGCSLEQLEMTEPPPSTSADLTGCNKTPIDEICTDWTCSGDEEENCCNSPVCTDSGDWIIDGDLCGRVSGGIDCDPADLADYDPIMCSGVISPEDTCMVSCGNSSFICPSTGSTPCEAVCQSNGFWDIPCVCNPSTLPKKVQFGIVTSECAVGEKCDASCASPNTVVKEIVCDPWKGFTGDCGCEGLGDELSCDTPASCIGFDPWACEHYEVGEFCSSEDYCLGVLQPLVAFEFNFNPTPSREQMDFGMLTCAGESGWEFLNGSSITDEDIVKSLCGCYLFDPCGNLSGNPLVGGTGGCLDFVRAAPRIITVEDGAECADNTATCGFSCSSSLYMGGRFECDPVNGVTCPSGTCNCCECDSTVPCTTGDAICGDPTDCSNQVVGGTSSLGCPSDTTFTGWCINGTSGQSCAYCTCGSFTCFSLPDGPICKDEFCRTRTCNGMYPEIGTCVNETCIPK